MVSVYGVAKAVWRRAPAEFRQRINCSPAHHIVDWLRRLLSSKAGHDELYDAEYFEWLDDAVRSSAAIMCNTVIDRFHPRSVIDVGCGSGALLSCLADHGVSVIGVDNSDAAIEMCRSRGLRVEKLDLEKVRIGDPRRYDVVVSLEVAEHLPASCADDYVGFLCSLGPRILFSAATPGQEGHDHVNLQPHRYWIRRFEDRGFAWKEDVTDEIRSAWRDQSIQGWYSRNLMVFESSVESQGA